LPPHPYSVSSPPFLHISRERVSADRQTDEIIYDNRKNKRRKPRGTYLIYTPSPSPAVHYKLIDTHHNDGNVLL
jgi:hypothetical protein